MSKRTLYLVHHSHTDIGYTDRQEKISRYHVDFIKSVIVFLSDIEQGKRPEWTGFKYTCENYWQVEQFMANSTPEEQQAFEYFVKKGWIDISLSYLNMTELVDETVLNKMFAKGRRYVDGLEIAANSAMTADINGFSWGYAEAMSQHGIENLFSCLHTHHGMFPLFKKQLPFWWETQTGHKVLVWNGDHYQTGNDFLLVPNSDQSKQYGLAGYTEEEADRQFKVTEERIFAHFELLAEEDYPYDFIPAMISGIVTDNAPPNPRMMETIHKWNERHGSEIEIKLVTLNEFFVFLRQQDLEIPTYSGDWADWWADGVGSTPAPTKIYRDAQRKYRLANKLDPEGLLGKPELLAEAEQDLMMYAEHTWGYHSSVGQPWNTFVNDLDYRKAAYAINANSFISRHLDEILAKLGEESIQMNRQAYYKVINPHHRPVTEHAKIYVKHWEQVDDSYFHTETNGLVEVVDCQTGEVFPSQVADTSLGKEIEFLIPLAAREERVVRLRRVITKKDRKNWNHAYIGTEQIADVASYEGYDHLVSPYGIETADFKLTLNQTTGIESLIDKRTGKSLLHEQRDYAPFAGVYEVTPITTDACTERRIMGRNRKGRVTERSAAVLTDVKVTLDGPLYTVFELVYQLVGTQMYTVVLRAYKDLPQINVTLRIQKDNQWAPENLYVPLPFSYGENSQFYVEKTGTIFRPGIDQLPGTNTDFYLLNNGATFTDGHHGLVVAIKDTPLITLGTLDSHLVDLCSPATAAKNHEQVYSWPMNNFWETNFKVDLSGFYEFDYQLYLMSDQTPAELIEKATELNEGIITIAYNPK
ncbi:hypothetical protein I6N95_20850 [Vagococcus sp. BWB3-3]|uniref:Glycoside hydrolase family 38 N-terminal domain-containing protein n=1 Tax=Vagococcus allomyrinae TaxID=2794353 RepID=A0A940P8V7_9ENTE|nr:hypothetical protein [Vagococcus allomyrinae]MBP1043477.1 hypothetical protein [Vagococcus allomyrinae]